MMQSQWQIEQTDESYFKNQWHIFDPQMLPFSDEDIHMPHRHQAEPKSCSRSCRRRVVKQGCAAAHQRTIGQAFFAQREKDGFNDVC